MTARKTLTKRSIAYIALISFGSMIAVMGVAILSVNLSSFKTEATVIDCPQENSCLVAYERNGQATEAVLDRPRSPLRTGDLVQIGVVEDRPDQAYNAESLTLGLPLAILTVALTSIVYGTVRLYQYWKRLTSGRVLAEQGSPPVDVAAAEKDEK